MFFCFTRNKYVFNMYCMKRANPDSPKTTINLDPTIKAKALELAQRKWGKIGTMSMLVSDLVQKEYGKLYKNEPVAKKVEQPSFSILELD